MFRQPFRDITAFSESKASFLKESFLAETFYIDLLSCAYAVFCISRNTTFKYSMCL